MRYLAVCDDDPTFLAQAKELASRYFEEEGIPASTVCYPDAESLLAARAHYDIYLLDILMPGMDGIALARELARRDRDYCVIYLTTSEEYALDAFAVDALQYLVKPVEPDAFFAALTKAQALLSATEEEVPRLLISTPDGGTSIRVCCLRYVEHVDKVLYFHLTDGEVLRSSAGSMTVSGLSARLLALPNFLSPHRAFLVNMDHIRTFSTSELCLQSGERIPVARTGGARTRRQYMDYLLERRGTKTC